MKRIRDFVSIRQGNRDLYTRCSMRAAAYSCVGIFPTRKSYVGLEPLSWDQPSGMEKYSASCGETPRYDGAVT